MLTIQNYKDNFFMNVNLTIFVKKRMTFAIKNVESIHTLIVGMFMILSENLLQTFVLEQPHFMCNIAEYLYICVPNRFHCKF